MSEKELPDNVVDLAEYRKKKITEENNVKRRTYNPKPPSTETKDSKIRKALEKYGSFKNKNKKDDK